MNLEMFLFLLGPVGAFGIVPFAMVLLTSVRSPPRVVWLGKVLAFVAAGSWLGYWILWQVVFGYRDAHQPVPTWVDVAYYGAMTAAALGGLGLVVTALIAVVRSRVSTSW